MWSHLMGDRPGEWRLCWSGRKVADLVWCHPPAHESVAMERIVQSLNRPRIDCRPSESPVWASRLLTSLLPEGVPPDPAEVLIGTPAVPDALVVWWREFPRGFDGWVQRIVDGLNAGHGLPVVLVRLADRPAPLAGPLEECAA